MESLTFSRRSLVFMFIGVAFALLCWGLRAIPATSPATRIEIVSAELEQLEAEVAAFANENGDELSGHNEHAAVFEDRVEHLSTTLRAISYYDSALSLGQFAGILIHLIAAWSLMGPVLLANLRDPDSHGDSRRGQDCSSIDLKKSANQVVHRRTA